MRAGFRLNSHAVIACMPGLFVHAFGCSELVGLGSECPVLDRECAAERDSGTPPVGNGMHPNGPDAAPSHHALDASDASATVDMVNMLPDARVSIPGGAAFPAVRNGSFELSVGVPGDVTTVSLPTATQIAPWYSCQPIGAGANPTTAVRAEDTVTLSDGETPPGAVVTAPDGSTFISMQYLVKIVPIPLVEPLDQPLQVGQHYAFAIDVRSTNPDAQLSLRVQGAGADDACLGGGEVLIETDPITAPGWQTLCLPFTASAQHTHVVLSLRSGALLGGALNSSTARLFFDNLRPASEAACPTL